MHVFVRPAQKFAQVEGSGTVSELVARARIDMLPAYRSRKSREEAERYLDAIDAEFGSRRYARHEAEAATGAKFLRRHEVQAWLHGRRERLPGSDRPANGPVAANRMVTIMGRVFALASSLWGLTEYNPAQGLQHNQENPRDQIPDQSQFDAMYGEVPEWMRCAMLIARDYARRRGEILQLAESDVLDKHLRFTRGKERNGRKPKEILIEWDEHLHAIVQRLQAWKAKVEYQTGKKSFRLLVNKRGGPVTEDGWNSVWRRAALKAGITLGDFHYHDLRAVKPSGLDDERQAQHLLAHESAQSTKVYRRGPHVIKADFKRTG